MSLLAKINKEAFDGLGKEVQEHYVVDGDNFTLGVDAVDGLELQNVTGLKTSLVTVRKQLDDSKKKGKVLEAFEGLDITEVKEAMEKVSEMENWDPDKKLEEGKKQMEKQLADKYEKMQTVLVKKHEEEFGKSKVRGEKLETQLRNVLVDGKLVQAIAEEKGIPELLLHPIKDFIKVEENDDGEFEVKVVDSAGNDRLSTKANSTASDLMSIKELVQEFKTNDTYARAFDGSGASGSGGSQSGKPSSGKPSHSITESEAQDPATYRKAKEAAMKDGKELKMI